MKHIILAAVLCGVLAACGTVPTQPADPATTQRIVQACLYSGLFKLATGAASVAVPAAGLPVSVVNAGVDRVCANPEAFAGDVSTVEWVIKNTIRK